MPPRVDFYLLKSPGIEEKLHVACRLIEKGYLRGHQVFVYCENQEAAEKIDEMLWTFKQDSFIPHNLQGEGPEPPPVVQIGYEQEPRGFSDILLNLSENIPSFFSKFQRIFEIVANDDVEKTKSRERYRQYRAMQCLLNTHNL